MTARRVASAHKPEKTPADLVDLAISHLQQARMLIQLVYRQARSVEDLLADTDRELLRVIAPIRQAGLQLRASEEREAGS